VDHFIRFDLPAVVEHVRRTTGHSPFLIGSSMGSMTIAGYLQGAALIGYGDMQSIVADEAAARQRRGSVNGCVLMEMPAALRWQRTLYDERGALNWGELLRDWRSTDSRQNFPFEWLARAGWVQVLLGGLGEIRLDWLRPGTRPLDDLVIDAGQETRPLIERMKLEAMRFFSNHFKGSTSFCAETFLDGLLHAVDHMKAGVLGQMGKSVRAGAFISAIGTPDHVYSDHYDQIAVPALVIVGGRDRIANADITREVLFDRLGSPDKSFLLFDDLAHGEFEYSPAASERVYPQIVEWISGRNPAQR
jgi:pimeloyl-ACP methyl ester carboxylesterase